MTLMDICCNGCPSTEGLKPILHLLFDAVHKELQWLSLDRGIETRAPDSSVKRATMLQWLSLDRGIETPQLGDVDIRS